MGPTSCGVFLYGASGCASSLQLRPRSVAGRGARVSDNSSPNWSGASRHGRDGSAPRTAGGSAAPHGSRSRDRFDTPRRGAPSGAAPPDASSARERGRGAGRAWGAPAGPAPRVFGTRRPTGTRNSQRHPQPVQSPTAWHPPGATRWPVGVAVPVAGRFLVVSCP
jgi:hypothetical protein